MAFAKCPARYTVGNMDPFHILVILHVIAGALGLIAFWVPIATKKGAKNHRRGGNWALGGFIEAGALAVAMAVYSLIDTSRHPEIADRALYEGLFGWMMLYLGILTIGFADYGLAVIRHRAQRHALRRMRYQSVMAAVVVSGIWCGIYGVTVGDPLMVLVAVVGVVSMLMQQVYVFREHLPGLRAPPRAAYVGEHFRALIGMGISAYTAFMSVGLIRLVPEEVFNPLVWAGPSVVGVGLIIWFTNQRKQAQKQAGKPKERRAHHAEPAE
ncbi:MAG: SemiSWEET family transporter [Pseudomonadota bacterium]